LLPRRREVRREDRRAEEVEAERAELYRRLWQTLTKLAETDSRIVGVTAAMPGGTGLNILQKAMPGVSSTSASPNSTP
jgi:deoxyxylulose-5-phosphate synthase